MYQGARTHNMRSVKFVEAEIILKTENFEGEKNDVEFKNG